MSARIATALHTDVAPQYRIHIDCDKPS